LAFATGFVPLVSGVFVSGFLTSGDVVVFGDPVVAGDVEGAVLGLVAGELAGVDGAVVTGLLGVSALGSQAPKIAVEAARTVAKTIDLLIDLYLNLSRTPDWTPADTLTLGQRPDRRDPASFMSKCLRPFQAANSTPQIHARSAATGRTHGLQILADYFWVSEIIFSRVPGTSLLQASSHKESRPQTRPRNRRSAFARPVSLVQSRELSHLSLVPKD
jgi:hypothetical protein